VGTTLESYDDLTGYKMTVDYEHGQPLASYERHGEHLYRIKHFAQGRFDSLITFHENGDTSELLTTGNIWHQQKWDRSGKQTDDYQFYNDVFIGKGYYTHADTTYIIRTSGTQHTYNSNPIERWVIVKNDTLRLDYIHNNKNIVDRIFPYYLHRNYFKFDSISNRYVRDGQWSIYEGNVISEVVTYAMGVKHGGYILYNASTPPTPMITGNYTYGNKNGLWVTNGGRKELISYKNGILDGLYRIIDSQNIVLQSGTFRDGLIVGDFTTYYENANKQSVVTYAPGQNIGYKKIYDHYGRLFSEGPVKRVIDLNPEIRNQPIGKWTFYTYNAKGKARKSTVKYGGFKAFQSQNPSGGSLPAALQSHFQPLASFHQSLLL
jgi:antitoxin component YwqK of YwqJK toxin-antitoxin module